MNRKQRRAAQSRRRKNNPEQAMEDKIQLFGKIPKQCDACQEPFDKSDKDMAFSWRVVVKGENVRLFCPACITKAQEILKENQDG